MINGKFEIGVDTPAVWLYYHADEAFTEYLNELCAHMSDQWDGDSAQSDLVGQFAEHYGDLDRAIDQARAEDEYNDEKPLWFKFDPESHGLVRTDLADHDRRIKAAAWDEAMTYVRSELQIWYDQEKSRIKIDDLTNTQVQPCFDAIDAAGTMTYGQYNAHIGSVMVGGMLDWFTIRDEIRDEAGELLYEGDEDPNPYRETS